MQVYGRLSLTPISRVSLCLLTNQIAIAFIWATQAARFTTSQGQRSVSKWIAGRSPRLLAILGERNSLEIYAMCTGEEDSLSQAQSDVYLNEYQRQKLRKALNKDVETFLKSGGKITECEPRQHQKIRITKQWLSEFTWKLKADQDEYKKKQKSV